MIVSRGGRHTVALFSACAHYTLSRDVIRVCVAGVTGWTGRAVAEAVEAAISPRLQ